MYAPGPLSALSAVARDETLAQLRGRIDLWCFFYEQEELPPELWDSYLSLLTSAERTRHDRYYFERDRRLFLATRALVRCVLSAYADVAPADWRFGEGERGRPHIEWPRSSPPLQFNLTNTPGLVVCAVSTAHPMVGVDAEVLDRPGETVSLAEHYFSPSEVRALRALPIAEQRARFFAYWTLKESYIKARGLGLAIPLDQFSFRLEESPPIGITFDPRLPDEPGRWQFALHTAGPRHLVAVGARTDGIALSLRAARFVPLRGERPLTELCP